MKKRILSLLLAFAMTLSMIPVQTFAEDTAAACPTCGEIGCMTHCQICGSDACETFHVQCSDCGAYDCTADHTASATEGATEKPTEQPTQAPTEGATQPAQSPVASIAETDETTVDNCPYCEETTAEDGTVTHAEGCNAAYVYDGTADVGKYAKLNEYYADSTVIVFDGTEELIFNYSDFEDGLIFKITDWNWDSETTALWYKVEAYSGTFPADMPGEPWMLQNYTNSSEEDSLLFVTIEEPTDPTEEPTEEPKDTCDICGSADCDGFHVYCDICAAYDCGKTHLYCNTHDKYDCTETHVWCGTCGKYNCGQTHENVYKPVTAPVIPENPTLTEGADVSIVDEYGGAVTEEGFALIEGIKSSLSAWTELEGVSYQWQVCYDRENDLWADIQGQTGRGILLSPAMLLNAMEDADSVSIRCVASTESQTLISEAIPVSIASPAAKLGLVPSSASAAVDTTAEDAEVAEKVNLIINYIFADGKVAANPWAATLPINTAYTTTTPITVPTIAGYTPEVGESDNADNATLEGYQLTLNFTAEDLAQDCSVNIVYQPAPVKVVVNHYWQNVDNDNYELHETIETTAVTGTTVGDVDKEYEGFYSLLYEHPTVAADGSTIVDVYYDRYYYLMTFDLNGGYGMDAIYARYGTPIENPGEPVRPGYILSGWTLDGNSAAVMRTMPARNITYVAVWTPAGEVNYTVVFWKENADNNNYSYWTQVTLQAEPGTLVSGSDSVAPYVSDEQYFTYNDHLTDKDVEIAGDGSTVINVYYNRNYYTIYFYGISGICAIEEHTHGTNCVSELICGANGHTHTADCQRTQTCTLEEHVHTDACLICGKTEHTYHTDACYTCTEHTHSAANGCTLNCQHTHTAACYGGTTQAGNSVNNYLNYIQSVTHHDGSQATNPESGYVYDVAPFLSDHVYYLYFDGVWYTVSADNLGTTESIGSYVDGEFYEPKVYKYPAKLNCTHSTHNDECYSCDTPVHTHGDGSCTYKDEIHTHSDSCYNDTAHSHGEECYTYQCGEEPHEHDDTCYRECYKPQHTHDNSCRQNRSDNVIYVITAKYEQDISSVWPTADKFPDTDLRGWKIEDASSTQTSKVLTMTPNLCDATGDGITECTAVTDSDCLDHLYYMFESFDQTSAANGNNRILRNGVYYDKSPIYSQDVNSGGGTWSAKAITGLNSVTVTINVLAGSSDDPTERNVFLYYTRNRWDLMFYNVSGVVKTEADVMYEQPLANYKDDDGNLLSAFVPAYPTDSFEPGTMRFEGWYTTPECYEGTKVDFSTLTMPNSDYTLYAKWVPVTRTVRFFLDKADLEARKIIPEKMAELYAEAHDNAVDANSPYTKFATRTDVSNRSYLLDVTTPGVSPGYENHPYNGYTFVGWFYLEDGEEKAFDPVNMPVTKDLDLYGKWSSNVLCPYEIRFALDAVNNETGEPGADGVADVDAKGNIIFVADSITGSTLAGNSRTFDAKGDTALYADYQTSYYPNVASHTIDFKAKDDDGDKEQDLYVFTFLYTPNAPVAYTVRYLEKGTNAVLAAPVSDPTNTKAVVTENFKPISGYMPDAYQKTLVVVPGGENVITFWYTKDETHAFYQVNHYVQNLDGSGWTEYRSAAFTGEIGKGYSGTAITIPGFTFSDDLTNTYNTTDKINAYTNAALPGTVTFDAASDTVSGTLTANGMQLNLYYTRNSYTYTVRYLEYGTNTVLHTEKTATVLYNTYVTEYAVNIERDLDGDGNNEDFQLYEATENPQTATIKDNTTVLTFYYVRCTQNLTVTKTVTGEGADPNQTFNFTLTSTAADFGGENDAYTYEIDGTQHTITATNKTLSFSLKAGQTIKFLNLPTAKYTVTEQELPLGYYCAEPAKEVTLTKDAEVAVTITNEYAPAALEVKKVVNHVDEVEDNVTDFKFKIKVPTGVTGSYDYTVGTGSSTATVDADGYMTITLKDLETAVFANLPTGEYIVAEADYTDEGYSATYEDNDGTTTDGVVTLVKGGTDTVTCTNAYPVGSLKISKTVKKAYAADAWSEDTFTFTVTRTDADLTNGNTYPVYSDTTKIDEVTVENNTLTVTIKVTKLDTKTTIKIDNLPKGSYTVTEAADADYTQFDREIETSIGPEDYAGSAEFTNTYTKHLGNLTITKTVKALADYTAPADAAFTFTVSGAALTKSTYMVSIVDAQGNVGAEATCNVNDGKLTVSLLGGQRAVIHDLDLAAYTVEEAANDQFVLTSYSGTSGTILADDTATAAFTNTYVPRGSLKVTKFIDRGLYDNVQIDTNQEFAFTVTLGYGLDVTETYACKVYTKAEDSSTVDALVRTEQLTLSADKELTFTLKHNQYIVIENLPAVAYAIEETQVEGYLDPNFMYGSETQAIPKDGTAEVTCYNPVELAPGDLKITKIINDTTDNQSAPRDQAFEFTVTLRNADSVPTGSYTVEYTCDENKGNLSTVDGVTTYTMTDDGTPLELATTVTPTEGDLAGEYFFTLTLYDGLTATICNLPPCAYYVEENDYSEEGFAGEWTGNQSGLLGGALIDGQNPLVDLTCTNVYPINTNGKLIIVKHVTKDYARDVLPGDTFTFTVTPTDGNTLSGDYTVKLSGVYTDANNVNVAQTYNVTATDGKLVVKIPFTADELVMGLNDSRSKQLIIEGLPLGQYDVAEAADEDYKQLPDGLEHSVSVGTNPGEAIFINEYKRHLGTLTISKEVTGDPPETDTFIFHISGDGVDMDVTITGSGSVTIYDLPLGEYTVTEDTDWSWRYTASDTPIAVDLAETPDATVSFTNTYNNNKWLNYFTNMLNTFGSSN